MKAEVIRFHSPLIDGIEYLREQRHENPPVNMSLVEGIQKSRMRWYPDNTGKPSILFLGTKIEWAFNQEEHRDREFARILSTFGPPSDVGG